VRTGALSRFLGSQRGGRRPRRDVLQLPARRCRLVNAARLPAIYPERGYADDGGLLAYGANASDNFRPVGQVDSVLKGVPANAIENCRSSESRKALTGVRSDQVRPVFLTQR